MPSRPLPPGLYDLPLTTGLARRIAELDRERLRAEVAAADPADADLLLARHLAAIVRQTLQSVPKEDRLTRQAEIINELLAALERTSPSSVDSGEHLSVPTQRLASISRIPDIPPDRSPTPDPRTPSPHLRPLIPLSQSDLLTNARGEPAIAEALGREIESADRIDLLCAFIRWSGLRLLLDPLGRFFARGGKMRVITTTYIGATQRRAVDRLAQLGAEVRISYLDKSTRLHAKAWLFHRDSGFPTAYIGSSNLSTAAMLDGLEWNVRLSRPDAPTILEKFEATFDSYWADPDFERYDPARDTEKFDRAIHSASTADREPDLTLFDLHPHPYQEEILQTLEVERYRHNRWQNLVVAATGTGKTVIAAFDYRRLCEQLSDGRPLRLLFVAHRREILRQSMSTFRHVMRDGTLGELYVDGHRPEEWGQVFASVQSLQNLDLERTPPDAFDVIVIDEFHHAAAPTYETILHHFTPRVLLGLTATPERMDGRSILGWFGSRIAAELRLWDALDRGFLVPFHYFGIGDEIDLSSVKWTRGRYDPRELENLYTADDARIRLILRELGEKVADVRQMRALGFCVGIDHARMMARRFNEAGIPSVATLGETEHEERDRALRDLRDRTINCIFAVDIFNEGVDVPAIDTVLFLRPTESATIFLQQLGRGLRRTGTKDCLTVLDFIGNANRNFRFDRRYRAILGGTRKEIETAARHDFPFLPPGCSMHLDRVAREHVLHNLKESLGSGIRGLVEELRSIGEPVTLGEFLERAGIEPEDIYSATRGTLDVFDSGPFQFSERSAPAREAPHVPRTEARSTPSARALSCALRRGAGSSSFSRSSSRCWRPVPARQDSPGIHARNSHPRTPRPSRARTRCRAFQEGAGEGDSRATRRAKGVS